MLYYFSRMAKKAILSRKDDLNKITRMGPFNEVDSSDSDLSSDDSTEDEDSNSDNKKKNISVKPVDVRGMKLGDCVVNLWATRSGCIHSDFAVTGWLLCPIKEVHDDMRNKCKQRHIDCATRVLEKLSYPATKKEIASKVDIFHHEF